MNWIAIAVANPEILHNIAVLLRPAGDPRAPRRRRRSEIEA
jgi:hypothetical protein